MALAWEESAWEESAWEVLGMEVTEDTEGMEAMEESATEEVLATAMVAAIRWGLLVTVRRRASAAVRRELV